MSKFNHSAICKCGNIFVVKGGTYLNGVRCSSCGLSHHDAIDIGAFQWKAADYRKWYRPSTWNDGHWEVFWCGNNIIEHIGESTYLLEKFNMVRLELIDMNPSGLVFRREAGWDANSKRIAKLKEIKNNP